MIYSEKSLSFSFQINNEFICYMQFTSIFLLQFPKRGDYTTYGITVKYSFHFRQLLQYANALREQRTAKLKSI